MDPAIIEKLQKILELAARGGTQGEMEAAMGRAKALAMRHQIDLATIGPREDKKKTGPVNVEKTVFKTTTRYVHPYHNWVLVTLEQVFGVKFLVWKRNIGSHPHWTQVYCIGETADMTIAVTLFPWLESLFPSLYHRAWKEHRVRKDFASANGYYLGLMHGIVAASKREEDSLTVSDRNTFALVVRDKRMAVEAEFARLYQGGKKEETPTRRQFDQGAMRHGAADGRNVNLNQVGGPKQPGPPTPLPLPR